MTDWARAGCAMVIACASIVGCGDVPSGIDAGSEIDAGAECAGEARLGCPCEPLGEVICRPAGPDLFCSAGTWIASADGPCPGHDGGVQTDAASARDGGEEHDDGGAELDAGTDGGATAEVDGGPDAGGGADAGAPDAGTPDSGTPATATYCVDIDVSNTCDMTVSPTEITIPAGQTAYFCWRNRSRDYAVDVWLSYGGGYTELGTGATWNEPVGHCLGPAAHTEYADISTACSEHRFLIRCL